MSATLHLADCREVMRAMPDCSVHAIVTDPPYEIGFMGHGWDQGGIAFDREVWSQALRVLVPGGHVLASGATKTWHWLAVAMELVGFEPRDSVAWIQGQGMPHGRNIGKAIDAAAGAEREVVGPGINAAAKARNHARGAATRSTNVGNPDAPVITAPATPEAATWEGWNTTLAPSHEPIVVMRKPLSESTVEANVLRWGAGGLNVDACRLEAERSLVRPATHRPGTRAIGAGLGAGVQTEPPGRWPPNVALDQAAALALHELHPLVADGCGADAMFYCPKAPTGERDHGCEHLRWMRAKPSGWRPAETGEAPDLVGNPHPTVKPLALMRWLLRLVTPTAAHLPGGGLVFDPFLGSGTTGVAAVCEGLRFCGSDLTPWAFQVAQARVRWAQGLGPQQEAGQVQHVPAQGSLFG